MRGYVYEESELTVDNTFIFIRNKDLLVVSHGDDEYSPSMLKKYPDIVKVICINTKKSLIKRDEIIGGVRVETFSQSMFTATHKSPQWKKNPIVHDKVMIYKGPDDSKPEVGAVWVDNKYPLIDPDSILV